jgi:hypothetical protein
LHNLRLPPLLGDEFSVVVTLHVDRYPRSDSKELMTFQLSGECVGQVCSEAIYEIEVALS